MMLHTLVRSKDISILIFRNMETEVQIQNYLVIVTVKAHLSGNRLQDNIFPCFSLSDYFSQCGLASRVLDYEKDISLINT